MDNLRGTHMRQQIHWTVRTLAAAMIVAGLGAWAVAEDSTDEKQLQIKRTPKELLTVFMNGYGPDDFPADNAQFEKIAAAAKKTGHFNAIMCHYTPEREAILKRLGMGMVVDLLGGGYHVFQNPKECEELLKKLRTSQTVVAYHLWSDRFGSTGAGRARDIANVHKWDPNHATYIGTYMAGGIHFFAGSDIVANYNFSWKRGQDKNYPQLMACYNVAKQHNGRLGRYLEIDAGVAGKGNFNRLLHTQNTAITFGHRVGLWHIARFIMNFNTLQLSANGADVAKVNAWLEPMRAEIGKVGLPYAIYATPWTKDYNDKPASGMPKGLEHNAFPADSWIQPASGEFVCGLAKYNNTDADVLYLANHNAYAGQDVRLKFTKTVKPLLFDRATGKYVPLSVTDNTVSFPLEPAGGAIVRFE